MSGKNNKNHYTEIGEDDPSLFLNEENALLQKSYQYPTFGGIERKGLDTSDVGTQVNIAQQKGHFQKCWSSFLNHTVEIFLFLVMFGYFTRSVCLTNLALDKACKVHFKYSDEICKNLSANATIKDEVEKIANDLSLYINLIHMIPGAVTMVFLGPWSDRYGRKVPLFLSLTGFLLDNIGIILNTVYFEAPTYYLLVCAVPSGIVGGFLCILTLTYGITSETSSKQTRTMKFAFLALAFGLGTALGTLTGGMLYRTKYSYYAPFGLSAIIHGMCVPWLLFLVGETRGLEEKVSFGTKVKHFFSLQNFIEAWQTCIKKRENKGRCQIWMLLAAMSFIVITFECFLNIAYLYTFHIYGWDPSDYSQVSTTFNLIGLAVVIFSVPLFVRVFKFQDATLGLIGTLSMMMKNLVYGSAANQVWLYYLGSLLGIFGGFAPIAIRTRISKLVDAEELGKVFAFLSTCESLVPQVGLIAITKLYDETLAVFPGAAYCVGGIVLIVPAGTFIWLMFLKIDQPSLKSGHVQDA